MPDNDFSTESYERITEYTASQDLSLGPLNFTTSFSDDVKINYITFKKSASTTQDAKVAIDALAGANYDTEILNETLTGANGLFFQPDERFVLKAGNNLKIEMTNTGTPSVTVYVVVSTSSV